MSSAKLFQPKFMKNINSFFLLIRWVGGSTKGQKHADVILEWSLIYWAQNSPKIVPRDKRKKGTLQMFAGIYRDFAGKSECGDFKFTGIDCMSAIPVIFELNQKKSVYFFYILFSKSFQISL